MIWLGEKRGNLSDWVTQVWVRAMGRRIRLRDHPWLDGPVGPTSGIGKDYFAGYAASKGLSIAGDGVRGLLRDFNGQTGVPGVDGRVAKFYERTSEYELDAWAEWSGAFRPFGWLLALLFSRRLQQLNVPLSGLDTSRGMTSEVLHLAEPETGEVKTTAWVRQLVGTGNLLYAGAYSVCVAPEYGKPCVKVVFPLPNGNAVVVMRPEAHADGSLTLHSVGEGFGDTGFYFLVHFGEGQAWARYVRTMRETIHVYPAEEGVLRTDHVFRIWGMRFLKLHYRMRRRSTADRA